MAIANPTHETRRRFSLVDVIHCVIPCNQVTADGSFVYVKNLDPDRCRGLQLVGSTLDRVGTNEIL